MPNSSSASGVIVRSQNPYNAEPTLDRLRAAFVTPEADFYVRSHGNVPQIDAETYRLTVDGLVDKPLALSMRDLRDNFAPRTVVAVMQCAGNRRADMQQIKPTSGDPWAPGAIGNAEWTGVPLADVLLTAGVRSDLRLHVAFQADDDVDEPGKSRFKYGASIPLAKAMAPEVLLAYKMNGEPLTPRHGFPLRVVVPGYAGVRSPKWLTGITVQDKPSDNPMQKTDYKLLPPDVTKETVDWEKGVTINELPLNAAICEPAPHAELKAGPTRIRGYAIVSGRDITRVDVSINGGRQWFQAELEPKPENSWSWTFWHTTLDLPKGDHELVVRAWDSAGQTQPANVDDTWNFKGYLCASWHRVPVLVV